MGRGRYIPRELFNKAADLGLFGIRIDPEWGGSGQDWWASTAYLESTAHSDSGRVNVAMLMQSPDRHRGVPPVLRPTATNGFSVSKKLSKIGNMASDTAELFFDECLVPVRNVLGELNQGFYYIMHNFQGERLAAAVLALAAMERSPRQSLEYAAARTAFHRVPDRTGVRDVRLNTIDGGSPRS